MNNKKNNNNNLTTSIKHSDSEPNNAHIDRRRFIKGAIQAGLVAAASKTSAIDEPVTNNRTHAQLQNQIFHDEYEYVIVGSGAGGGPLAANLAKAGYSVLVLEAGNNDPSDNIHNIPAWHPFSSEDPKISWDFFVNHYENSEAQKRDSKYVPNKGVLYPRASTIGGCTTHHALITVYPHNNDFDRIAQLTEDDSWNSENMRQYFERLERCEYLPSPPFSSNAGRHGFDGWLPTNQTQLRLLLEDPQLLKIVKATLMESGIDNVLEEFFSGNLKLDINDWSVAKGEEGAFLAPMAATEGRRQGVREYLLETQARYPDRLHIRTNALASRVLFEGKRATGVEFMDGENLYQADPLHNHQSGTKRQVMARREVILSGGAFNSPQLLKLSGIGPASELEEHGITPIIDLPGVGENLQDRYEVGVVSEMNENLSLTESCTWGEGNDPCLNRYFHRPWNRGPYASNGPALSLVKRSFPERVDPDLFIFGLPTDFHGYFPSYSDSLKEYKDRYSWLVLKGHTNNNAGRVTLRSNDPQETPVINFHYFDEGNDDSGEDLKSVVEGVKIARNIMNKSVTQDLVKEELLPGKHAQSDEEVAEYVKNEAWGHHASCTNKMGHTNDPMAVVDSKFRVMGTENLRVVDASVFPYIPGFFIVVPVYMISEKASDDIIATAMEQAIV